MQSSPTLATTSFYGFINDHYDALLLVTAARMGLIPRFRRRLDMVEQRTLITSGAIFLWNEEESSMKRWTDGFPWSPSRIQHKFLIYREMAERGSARIRTSARLLRSDPAATEEILDLYDDRRRKAIRNLTGSLFNQGEFENLLRWSTSGNSRPDDVFRRGGLVKKTFTLALPQETWHLVGYYTLEDVLELRFATPKDDPFFKNAAIINGAEDLGVKAAICQAADPSITCTPSYAQSIPQEVSPYYNGIPTPLSSPSTEGPEITWKQDSYVSVQDRDDSSAYSFSYDTSHFSMAYL
ncbi:hypothetical protein M422DRAFT_245448 [Sphaerobolus stellatus SS14]|nr:hypothetical protein M422DRAFT_245448 [Sphaerobolus stellatus SS14]